MWACPHPASLGCAGCGQVLLSAWHFIRPFMRLSLFYTDPFVAADALRATIVAVSFFDFDLFI